jgi:hypothetical protein
MSLRAVLVEIILNRSFLKYSHGHGSQKDIYQCKPSRIYIFIEIDERYFFVSSHQRLDLFFICREGSFKRAQ